MDVLSGAVVFLLCLPGIALAQPAGAAAASTAQSQAAPPAAQKDPVLTVRPPAAKGDSAEGRIQLDVVVTGKQGGPVSGLEMKDFTVLDDKQAQKILTFQAFDQSAAEPDAPAEVILLIDAVNATFQQVAMEREQIAKFLNQNGGHLAQPVSIFWFAREGLRVQPRPSVDGNALLEVLGQVQPGTGASGSAASGLSEIERFQFSVQTLTGIALNEAHSARTVARVHQSESQKRERKLLIWIGPGWPLLAGPNYASTSQDRQRSFDAIIELSTKLREARMVLYNVSQPDTVKAGMARGLDSPRFAMSSAETPAAAVRVGLGAGEAGNEFSYKEFLKAVKTARQADSGNLALQVLAVESGGRVLDPSNDLAGQIANCLADLGAFYTLTFSPPRAGHADEYHDLKVLVGKPGLAARTNTGYYNQP